MSNTSSILAGGARKGRPNERRQASELLLGMRSRKSVHLFALALSVLLVGCQTYRGNYSPTSATSTNSFASPKGGTYRVVRTTETDRFKETAEPRFEAFRAPTTASAELEFAGKDRAVAKTSIASAPNESFGNLRELLSSLPSDGKMLQHTPPISKRQDSNRAPEEMRNVTVNAFLYAAKKEDDHDYHVILGSSPVRSQSEFMNVEISGLPAGGPHRAVLATVRLSFESHLRDHLPGASGYSHYDPPIPVRVSGSLFYDIDHKPGAVGPKAIKPKTAWEIHPITKIEFEP